MPFYRSDIPKRKTHKILNTVYKQVPVTTKTLVFTAVMAGEIRTTPHLLTFAKNQTCRTTGHSKEPDWVTGTRRVSLNYSRKGWGERDPPHTVQPDIGGLDSQITIPS